MNTETMQPMTIRIRPLPLMAQGGHGGPECRCWMVLGRNGHFPHCPNAPRRKEKSN